MKRYKYLDLPKEAPEWLKEAHAQGHAGVLCKVWNVDKANAVNAYIIGYSRRHLFVSEVSRWRHAEPIWEFTDPVITARPEPTPSDLYYPAGKVPVKEPECETVKIRIRPFIGGTSGRQIFAYLVAVEQQIKKQEA